MAIHRCAFEQAAGLDTGAHGDTTTGCSDGHCTARLNALGEVHCTAGGQQNIAPDPDGFQVNLAADGKGQVAADFGHTGDIQITANAHGEVASSTQRVSTDEVDINDIQIASSQDTDIVFGFYLERADVAMPLAGITVDLQEDIALQALRATQAKVTTKNLQ